MNLNLYRRLHSALLNLIHSRLGYEGEFQNEQLDFLANVYNDYDTFINRGDAPDEELDDWIKFQGICDNKFERNIVAWCYTKLLFGVVVHQDYNLRISQRLLNVCRLTVKPHRRSRSRSLRKDERKTA